MNVIGGLQSGQRFLADARARDLDALSPADLAAEAAAIQSLEREAAALKMAVLAAANRKNAHRATDAVDMTGFVAREAGVTRREAAQQVLLAERIETAPRVKDALAKPGMSTVKAAIVTGALADLPSDLRREQRDRVEADLAEAAQVMSAEQLRRKCRRAIEVVDVDRADRIENDRLERDENAQRRLSEFWIGRPDDETGLVPFGGKTDQLTADVLRAVIESKTAPRKQSESQGSLTPVEKAGEAFAEIVRHLPREAYGNHGGVAATLVVTVDEKTLRGETDRAGVTEFGTPVSAGELRKLACDAAILPMIMSGKSQPLDIGRAQRLHTEAQRLALAQRDQGCAYPGCDRPPGWCESHHAIPWSEGGATNTETGVLLCAHHHRYVHNVGIPIRFTDGMPEFKIRGEWQQNRRYRPLPISA